MRIVNVAKVLIRRNSDGKYLLLRGSKWEERPERSQKPDLAGGVVEPGETVAEGAAREVFEEAGISVQPSDLTLVYATTFKSVHDGASINRLLYVVELSSNPNITLSWEHEGYWWLSKDEVLTLDIREPYPEIFTYLDDAGVLT
jgi:8-oxo-dGTP pyrophosphatase MutT (NUDIX family)